MPVQRPSRLGAYIGDLTLNKSLVLLCLLYAGACLVSRRTSVNFLSTWRSIWFGRPVGPRDQEDRPFPRRRPAQRFVVAGLTPTPDFVTSVPGIFFRGVAAAKPVICTRFGPKGRDLLEQGEIVLPDKPEAFAEPLARLLRDRACRRTLGRAARPRVDRDDDFEALRWSPIRALAVLPSCTMPRR